MLEVDPIALVRGKGRESGPLAQYVNDRPYVASVFFSVAIAQVLRSALNGVARNEANSRRAKFRLKSKSKARRAASETARELFEPLGYQVEVEKFALDARFPAWGEAPFVRLKLRAVKS